MTPSSKSPSSTSTAHECVKTRLAESAVAAVDLSDCGVMYLHLGALTLRLAPSVLSELLATLGEAVAMHACQQAAGEEPLAWITRLQYGDS
ncbi:MAG: hypothetical protein H6725_19160 [Sandaracinaceae bacterium]|nr:hypothetical protein [Sandaracinaceae bacterium]